MKRVAYAIRLAVLTFVPVILAQTPDHQYTIRKSVSAEQELIKLENELNEAWINRDIAPFDRVLADDYMETEEEGNVMTNELADGL